MSEIISVELPASSASSSRAWAYLDLTKPRITALVLVATAVGFYLALPADAGIAAMSLLPHTLLGTFLVAAGANALNQYLEAEYDAKMPRTADRPLPSERLSAPEVLAFALVAGVSGVGYLALGVNVLSAGLAALTFISYVFLYTPLKRITPSSVFVGAVPGALPPVIGWAGATDSLALEAWLLFGIVFFWQLPHFAAIAWLYRDDYAHAGFPVLPVIDVEGTRTNLHVITHSVGLLAASLLPALCDLAGAMYAVGAIFLGLAFLGCSALFVLRKTAAVARFHLMASVTYLPALFGLLMIDKVRTG